jgi:hypothetical protein
MTTFTHARPTLALGQTQDFILPIGCKLREFFELGIAP